MIRNVKLGSVAIEAKESVSSIPPGTPIVGLEHLDPEELTLSRWDITDKTTFTKTFKKGDVLFGRRRAYLKKAAVAPFDGVCSGDITVIRAMPNKIRPGLLAFLIQNDRFFAHAVKNSDGSLSPRAKWASLKEFAFALDDDLSVQDRILDMLVSINNTKLEYKKVLAKCDELIKSRFVEMFGTFECPRGTVGIKSLLELGDCIAGATPSTKIKKYWENGTIPWLSSGEVEQGRIYSTVNCITQDGYDSCSTRLLPRKSIFIAMAGQGKTRGFVGISELELCTNQSICGINPKPGVNQEFLFWNLRLQYDRLRSASNGDSGRGGLNLGIIEKYQILWPDESLQNKFVAFAEGIDKLKFGYAKEGKGARYYA